MWNPGFTIYRNAVPTGIIQSHNSSEYSTWTVSYLTTCINSSLTPFHLMVGSMGIVAILIAMSLGSMRFTTFHCG